jgi:hypothetical protein
MKSVECKRSFGDLDVTPESYLRLFGKFADSHHSVHTIDHNLVPSSHSAQELLTTILTTESASLIQLGRSPRFPRLLVLLGFFGSDALRSITLITPKPQDAALYTSGIQMGGAEKP